MAIYYIDGAFVPQEEAQIPVGDVAVLRGFGIFDYTRTYGGRPFKLAEHLARLSRSAAMLDLALPWSESEIGEIVLETLRRNQLPEAGVRVVVTGGDSRDGIMPGDHPRLLVLITPFRPSPEIWYSEGVKIITVEEERYLPGAKSINYIPAILALREARRLNAVDALYVDRSGAVREGTTTNYFIFSGGRLITPEDRLLWGITRQVILELAREDFPVEIREIRRDELYSADEIFLASSNKEVCPVVQVDDRTIGSGKPGPHTLRLLEIFREYARQSALEQSPP